jgi:hypothetical protein
MQVREITPRQKLTPAELAMPITPDAHNMSLSRRFKVVRANPDKSMNRKDASGAMSGFYLAGLMETGNELYIARHRFDAHKTSLLFYTSIEKFMDDETVFEVGNIKTLGDLQAAMYDAFSCAFMLREVSKKRKAPEPPFQGVPPPPIPPDN